MKRLHLFIAAVIAAVIAIPTAAVSAAPADSVHGPPCANIEVSGFAYSTFTGPRTVSGTLGVEQQDPSCSSVTYTVYVYSADGNTLLGSEEFVGDGVWTEQLFSISPSPAPDVICL